ncbi:hypothetical protein CCGE531_29495 (plasmid) [Rhizobium sp. CCGE531]|nr:hypothetical protein CCGE531_29495 [Rhizobium sp. CCGE531]AYG76550.1 hypothetical protein CCGE532_28970 [Rhizobium sp. CCGE532]
MNVNNTSGGVLTLNSDGLDWGKWTTNPPTQITNNQIATFSAEGAKGSATGTQGSVVYYFSDNVTYLTISFDIPYTGANSGGLNMAGTGMSNYSAQETDDTYKNVVSFPSSGDSVTTYFAIGLASSNVVAAKFDFSASVKRRLTMPKARGVPSVDIATAARNISCGAIPGPELVKIFNGKTEATALDVLSLAPANLDRADVIRFAALSKIVPTQTAFTAALDFASHVVTILKPAPEAYGVALDLIEELKKYPGDGSDALTEHVDQLENIKVLMLSSRTVSTKATQVAAIEALLACVYMDTGAALAQAASCAQLAVAGTAKEKTIVQWQFDYLLKALKA